VSERILLDTNIVLVAMGAPALLSAKARRLLEHGDIHISVIAYWEIQIKDMKGKIDVGSVRQWWANSLTSLSATVLPIYPDHIHEIAGLPPLHKDPFDRALLAQALFEGMTVVTSDETMAEYANERLRVLHVPFKGEISF
jgi:PIN domain nuclease of toxin-antitoxin system